MLKKSHKDVQNWSEKKKVAKAAEERPGWGEKRGFVVGEDKRNVFCPHQVRNDDRSRCKA